MLQTITWAGLPSPFVLGWFGESFVGWVGDLVLSLGGAVRAAIYTALTFLSDFAWENVLSPMLDMMPASIVDGLAAVRPWMDAANAWAPINEWLLMIGAYFAIWSAFVAFKFIFKAIPTVG